MSVQNDVQFKRVTIMFNDIQLVRCILAKNIMYLNIQYLEQPYERIAKNNKIKNQMRINIEDKNVNKK